MTLIGWLKRQLSADARRAREDKSRTDERVYDDANDDADIDPFNPFPEPVLIELTDVFDLHTIPPRDVKGVVEAYLEEAHRAGYASVRLIHGKGRGVQREIVRRVLSRTSFVRDFTDAPPEAGGWGATIAHLSSDKRALQP